MPFVAVCEIFLSFCFRSGKDLKQADASRLGNNRWLVVCMCPLHHQIIFDTHTCTTPTHCIIHNIEYSNSYSVHVFNELKSPCITSYYAVIEEVGYTTVIALMFLDKNTKIQRRFRCVHEIVFWADKGVRREERFVLLHFCHHARYPT